MKILLDPQTYNEQKFGGISRYYTEVYIELKKMQGVKIECPIVYSDNLHLKEHRLFDSCWNKFLLSKLFKRKARARHLKRMKEKNFERTEQALKKQDFDVFVATYYNPYFLENLGEKPYVLTVYDMIHEVLPQYFPNDGYLVQRKKLLIEKAATIIAISESTKKDILRFYPQINPLKITVIYLAQSINIDKIVAVDLPENYILFVGNRTIYKNFTFFIKTVAPILKSNPEIFVVCAGGNRFEAYEEELLRNLGIIEQIIQRNFADHELASYYSGARCFVFPSEYEGFGIPILEAMACGCPVLLANHSSFPEVAGTAGVYFELNNPEDLYDKLIRLLTNIHLRNEYALEGLKQSKKFSWQKTAEQCLQVYRSVI